MQRSDVRFPFARRSFLSRLGGGLVAAGTALSASASTALAYGTSARRLAGDAPCRGRVVRQDPRQAPHVLDAVSARGVGEALHFASNIITTSKSGYGLESNEVAIVVCLRHAATAFAFTDAIWSKYGASLPPDPKTNATAMKNLYNSSDRRDEAFDALIKLGVHFAVCDKSTQGLAGSLARKTDGKSDAVYKDCSRT